MNSRSIFASLLTAVVCVLIAPAAASARVDITAFSVTPSTTQAGANPNLVISTSFSSNPASDDAATTTVRLPPGVVGNPKATPKCSAAQFNALSCPANTRIGSVSVDADTATGSVRSPGDVYNLSPLGAEPARLGIVVRPPIGNPLTLIGVAKLGPETGYALETTFSNQPRQVQTGLLPLDITVRKLDLTLLGRPGGAPFTINPSSCATGTATATVTSYGGQTSSRTAPFTATGCAGLAFKPKVSGTIGRKGLNRKGAFVPLTTVFDFPSANASLKDSVVTLPLDVTANLAALTRACPEATPVAQCPATANIGSAKAVSPLLDKPLTGPVVLKRSSGPLPKLVVRLSGAVPLTLEGQTSIVANRLKTTFPAAPDTPLSRFELSINGGKGGLLEATEDLCRKKPRTKTSALLVGWNGVRSSQNVALKAAGCKGYKPPKPNARGSLKGGALKLRVGAGRYTRLKKVVATLPSGVRVSRKQLKVRSSKRTGTKLTAKSSGARTLTISARKVRVSRRLVGKRVKVKLAITDNYRRTVRKTVTLRVRR